MSHPVALEHVSCTMKTNTKKEDTFAIVSQLVFIWDACCPHLHCYLWKSSQTTSWDLSPNIKRSHWFYSEGIDTELKSSEYHVKKAVFDATECKYLAVFWFTFGLKPNFFFFLNLFAQCGARIHNLESKSCTPLTEPTRHPCPMPFFFKWGKFGSPDWLDLLILGSWVRALPWV